MNSTKLTRIHMRIIIARGARKDIATAPILVSSSSLIKRRSAPPYGGARWTHHTNIFLDRNAIRAAIRRRARGYIIPIWSLTREGDPRRHTAARAWMHHTNVVPDGKAIRAAIRRRAHRCIILISPLTEMRSALPYGGARTRGYIMSLNESRISLESLS